MTVQKAPATTLPGPVSAQMLDELARYVVTQPHPFVLDLANGEGLWLVTVDGQRLFDWCGYYGSKLLGHNHPGLQEPEYLKRLTLAANNKTANPDFLTPECLEFYKILHRLAPKVMRNPRLEVYTVNSGAEAVENMMKYLVSRFNSKKLAEEKPVTNRRFVYFDKAFHGRTVYALAVTQTLDPVATKDFHGLTSGGNIKLPFPAFDADRTDAENERAVENVLSMVEMTVSQMKDEIVGVIVEPIQGAGGQRVALPSFFQGLSRIAHEHGVALAFDEVQTGLGATGKMFAIDHFELPHPPLAVAGGKKFGTGVVWMYEPLEEVGVLDSTWGGTLADMVRVTREIEILEEERLVERAATTGAYLAHSLKRLQLDHQGVMLNVRGMGLYQGFSLDTEARKTALVRDARDQESLLLLGGGERSIRLRPNLSVTQADVDLLLEKLDRSLTRVS
ncbi:MAG: aminotransferase class III-fold pyridoxal phosphate-dependent enzyme [Fimbriimonadaceae bacterium]|nr:aminotransferase class III-fold pyridoxal phosphate-dependent enzyme [Fimbriimonadaceae bacterium]QYK58791.1 MAG: aminotransferase class III-fold pyridoxal phosphate-dependent enzyme [Fimbriimonadaceae bacterium]